MTNKNIYRILISADNGHKLSDFERDLLLNCESINWSFSTEVKEIPKHIYLLQNLQFLDLSGLGLTVLPDEMCNLSSLNILILKGNNLNALPNKFSDLENLQTLDLSRNNWNEFPTQIRNFKKLTCLNISHCSFSHIPGWIIDYNLDFQFQDTGRGIILEKTESPEIPILHQPRNTIIKYYTKLKEENLIVREAKVVFLGDGTVGKTYTIDRIQNDNKALDENHKTDETKGISIVHKDFYHNSNSVTINFWDFGGQQIMHAMHRCFLTGNTIYVIVLSGRAEHMERRLHNWMTTINSFISSDCPVVVLQNLFDVKNESTIDVSRIKRKYKNILNVLELNVKTASEHDFKVFVETLLDVVIKHTHYGARIPKHWAGVKSELEKSEEPYLTKDSFKKLLREQSMDTVNDEEEILDWLNEIGTSFSYHRKPSIMLHEYVVLNPEWATNAIYAIITSKLPKKYGNGIIELDIIERILKDTEFVNNGEDVNKTYSPSSIEYVLQLMENFFISFRIYNEQKEFIPSLCNNKEPKDIDKYINEADLHFEIHYSYLPSNILHQLMIKHYNDLQSVNKWWYSGGVFVSDSYQCSALIFREATHNEDDRISIYIRNLSRDTNRDDSWRYLQSFRKQLEDIGENMNITPTGSYIIYSEPDKTLSEKIQIDKINEYIKLGWTRYQSTVFKKEIPITEILKGITPIYNAITKKDLLSKIIAGCSYMQKRSWLPNKEDIRNDYLCDILRSTQVLVLDQSRSGKANCDSGELDFLFQDNSSLQDYAIMEAMNLQSVDKNYIQDHITKLVDDRKYNSNGLKELYLLVYADVNNFSNFCSRYIEYAKTAEYNSNIQSVEMINSQQLDCQHNIVVWKFMFKNDTELYHIIVKFSNNI